MAQRCRYCGIKRFAVLMKETWLAWLYDNVGDKNLKGEKKKCFRRHFKTDDSFGKARMILREVGEGVKKATFN